MNKKILSYATVFGLILFLAGLTQAQGPRYTQWSGLEPVTAVNTSGPELAPCITHDGLRLYFFRGGDIYVSHRSDQDAEWEEPVALPSPVNLPAPIIDTTPFESVNGHWLFFSSNRPGGSGGVDIWVSYRKFIHDDMAWNEPVNLAAINSIGFEGGPMIFEDAEAGTVQMFFAAAPYAGGTQALADVYVSTLGFNGFGAPVPVAELNSSAHDGKPWVRRDGLEIYFASYRQGLPDPFAFGSIYSSTRWSTDDPWSTPVVAIGTTDSGSPGDRWITTPSLSRDNLTLYVAANQPGTDIGDIYVAHRRKVKGSPSLP